VGRQRRWASRRDVGMISQVTSTPVAAQHLHDLARLRRVRDRIDREYAQPLDVEALSHPLDATGVGGSGAAPQLAR
jgi:hypothetical protein